MTAPLAEWGWAEARVEPLAGDASARRYSRLALNGRRAVLMEDPAGDTGRFARLARYLRGIGLSAPEILAEAPGALLLEDLGDALLARIAGPETEPALYALATDALVALHAHAPAPDLPVATPRHLAAMTDLAFTHYARTPERAAPAAETLEGLLQAHAPDPDVTVLRDYHAENILHLPHRAGVAQAGLLDFQDAMLGHRAYDLASLLRDARRDVAPATAERCIERFCAATGARERAFRAEFAVLAVQRNLRILGVFARLASDHGKPGYLALLPRVWAHLQTDLAHPVLAPLRPVLAALPEPDAVHRESLRRPCPTA